MAVNCVGGETNELCAPFGEFRLKFCEGAEFGGADGSVVLWMGEKDDPVIANELYSHISSRLLPQARISHEP